MKADVMSHVCQEARGRIVDRQRELQREESKMGRTQGRTDEFCKYKHAFHTATEVHCTTPDTRQAQTRQAHGSREDAARHPAGCTHVHTGIAAVLHAGKHTSSSKEPTHGCTSDAALFSARTASKRRPCVPQKPCT